MQPQLSEWLNLLQIHSSATLTVLQTDPNDVVLSVANLCKHTDAKYNSDLGFRCWECIPRHDVSPGCSHRRLTPGFTTGLFEQSVTCSSEHRQQNSTTHSTITAHKWMNEPNDVYCVNVVWVANQIYTTTSKRMSKLKTRVVDKLARDLQMVQIHPAHWCNAQKWIRLSYSHYYYSYFQVNPG